MAGTSALPAPAARAGRTPAGPAPSPLLSGTGFQQRPLAAVASLPAAACASASSTSTSACGSARPTCANGPALPGAAAAAAAWPHQHHYQRHHSYTHGGSRGLSLVTSAARGSGSSANGGSGSSSGGGAAAVAVAERVEDRELVDETHDSYLSYAMSVIVSRALPDVRDGLKPVHRRILYAMHELGLVPTKPYKKCARVVGEVLGKFHPHGDNAVYDSLVRLAQDFAMRLPLVQGHGNFGSVDADPAAAMRYTECRLAPAAGGLLLGDLGPATVEWRDTFDASQQEPVVLPAVVPNLLVNGSQGIAVGLASTIPPHNLREVVAALRRLIANPQVTTEELMECVRGPDYPTGGQLLTGPELLTAYSTGRGSVVLRGTATIERDGSSSSGGRGGSSSRSRKAAGAAKAKPRGKVAAAAAAAAELKARAADSEEEGGGKELIVITELPYSVCKAQLVADIAHMAAPREEPKGRGRAGKDGSSASGGGGGGGSSSGGSGSSGPRLEGVSDVRDESDRTGMRVVVEVKPGYSAELLLAQLFKETRLQVSQSFNCVALCGSSPQLMGLKDMLAAFLEFRCEVVTRRTQAALSAAQQRLHLVDGFLAVLGSSGSSSSGSSSGSSSSKSGSSSIGNRLDAVVADIRAAPDAAAAREALVSRHGLSEAQAEAVLGLTLRRLTSLEAAKLDAERLQLNETAAALSHILDNRPALLGLVEAEAAAAAEQFGDERRTAVLGAQEAAAAEPEPAALKAALVPAAPCLLLASRRGFLRRLHGEALAPQQRNTRGKTGLKLRSGDALSCLVSGRDRDELLLLAPDGRAFATNATLGTGGGGGAAAMAAAPSPAGASVANVLKLESSFPVAALLPVPPHLAAASRTAATSSSSRSRRPAAAAAAAAPGAEPAEHEEEAEHDDHEVEEEADRGEAGPSVVLCSVRGSIKRIALPPKITRAGLVVMGGMQQQAQGQQKGKGKAQDGGGDDELGWAALVYDARPGGGDVVVAVTAAGQAVLFPAGDLRRSGRAAHGVKAVALGSPRRPNDRVADLTILPAALAAGLGSAAAADEEEEHEEEHDEEEVVAGAEQAAGAEGAAPPAAAVGPCLLVVTAQGSGKRIPLSQLSLGRRAQAGRKVIKLGTGRRTRNKTGSAKSGSAAAAPAARSSSNGTGPAAAAGPAAAGPDRVVACLVVGDGDEVVLASRNGVLVRQSVDTITVQGCYTRGTFIMSLDAGDEVADVALSPREEEEEQQQQLAAEKQRQREQEAAGRQRKGGKQPAAGGGAGKTGARKARAAT
ncbi:hypothetical protein HXX76_010957 [Chlamydomonas incerta]|uniref:DNA topoisomerase (ATP-hydrolyzing) n=1 Tax=Chlamydomonas incerta TaxID=51695 RepID=A0A835SA82_CHLIN|nr:hypothetical protein HXX76_010957 [Chlamydomonas incerta]|eukprot:KAG2423189.1 hypothetical protein HXX76_010957 [Chlamydomonas incerta]